MRRRAYEKRKRREEVHLIGIRNEIRGAMGGDPIEDPYASPVQQDSGKDSAARTQLLRQMDLGGTEELAPEDLAEEIQR